MSQKGVVTTQILGPQPTMSDAVIGGQERAVRVVAEAPIAILRLVESVPGMYILVVACDDILGVADEVVDGLAASPGAYD